MGVSAQIFSDVFSRLCIWILPFPRSIFGIQSLPGQHGPDFRTKSPITSYHKPVSQQTLEAWITLRNRFYKIERLQKKSTTCSGRKKKNAKFVENWEAYPSTWTVVLGRRAIISHETITLQSKSTACCQSFRYSGSAKKGALHFNRFQRLLPLRLHFNTIVRNRHASRQVYRMLSVTLEAHVIWHISVAHITIFLIIQWWRETIQQQKTLQDKPATCWKHYIDSGSVNLYFVSLNREREQKWNILITSHYISLIR